MEEQARADLYALMEAMPDAAILVTIEHRVVAFNAPARTLAPALRAGGLIVRALRATEVLDAMDRLFSTGEPQVVAWRERVPIEREFKVHVRLFEPEGGAPCALATFRDITEARALDRMRADFVANASHELRTPLASILGFIETLQGPARSDDAARERFLTVMATQARRMARLIDDLLSLSRIEQHAHVPPREKLDLAALAAQTVDNLRAMAREAGVELRLAAAQPVFVAGARDELLRAAENLVENAIKYGAPSPVEVKVSNLGERASLAVSDQGPGIASQHIPRLTERFYRVDDNASRAKGGTGLGLAIVKHIVARHRGRLEIESAPGRGARFAIVLPKWSAD